MKKIVFAIIALTLATNSWSQKTKKEKDIAAIKAMSGCFKVGFNFTETFNYSKDSAYTPSKTKHETALEWVEVVTDNSDKIQLQHLLIVGKKENPHIVKHWRQDWIYENQNFYQFYKDKNWKYVELLKNEVTGQWTQKVYQVDDSPRYEGSATWVHVDGKSYWENKTDAPLARREHTQRNDYNVLVRRNRHEITNNGWIHNQDNDKVIRKDNENDFLLAQEKGYNTYEKVENSKCEVAISYWKDNKRFWKHVRNTWDNEFKMKKDITLQAKVDNKPLFMHIFKLGKDAKKKEIEEVITKFLKS